MSIPEQGRYNAPLTELDLNEVRRYAGLQTSEFSKQLLTTAVDELRLLAKPQSCWHLYDYNAETGQVKADQPYRLPGRSITNHLAIATKVIFLAATVGKKVEEAITAYFNEGNYTLAILLDAAATAAVEKIANDLERTLRPQFAAHGYQFLSRFSPGYGDWDITAQKRVLPLTDGETIGLELTPAMMLVPRKSITAVIGLTANECLSQPEKNDPPCQHCNKTNCLARKSNSLVNS